MIPFNVFLGTDVGRSTKKQLNWRKNTSLDWRMQAIEDDWTTLQNKLQGGNGESQLRKDDCTTSAASPGIESETLCGMKCKKTAADVPTNKGKVSTSHEKISNSDWQKLEKASRTTGYGGTNTKSSRINFVQWCRILKKRLIALESRPTESALSNVSFADDPSPTAVDYIDRNAFKFLESKVNNLATLQSSISSTPLEPPEGMRKGEGPTNDPSSTPLVNSGKFLFTNGLQHWKHGWKSYIGGIQNTTLGFTMSELEGRLLKRILLTLKTQLTRINVQELPK